MKSLFYCQEQSSLSKCFDSHTRDGATHSAGDQELFQQAHSVTEYGSP